MKNLPLVLSTVLLVAVGVLYYLHFSSANPSSSSSASLPTGSIVIAYIKSDSIVAKYDFVKDRTVILEAKSKKLESDYRNRAQSLQNEFNSYQRNRGNLTIGQDQAVQEDLGKKRQNLQLYEQSIGQELMDDQSKVQQELYERITKFLKKYAQEKGLQVVVKFDQNSDVLYGAETLDVTNDVMKGLNDEYQAEKSGGKVKADSTATK